MSIELAGVDRFNTVRPFDHRRLDRRACDLRAALATSHGEIGARIVNISAAGVGFTIDPMLGLKPGERVILKQETLGEVRCIVRWTMHPRYGAEFEPGGRTPPGAHALYEELEAGSGKAG
jgi:PilZ domain